ncbi:MAG: MBL fold metallo-hydrolase [Paracoccaceae bacterium]
MTSAPIRTPYATPPAEGCAIEVDPGILWMRLPLPMALDHVNIYALDDGDGWTLIDTGFDSRRSRAIFEALLTGPLAGKPVTRVIVTHHHPDHVGLAGWFVAQGAELVMTRTAWLMARMLTLDVQDRPSPEQVRFYERAGMDAEVLAQRRAERPFNFADCVAALPLGFTRLTEGQSIRIGQRNWTVRIGHGHAPAHATFWRDDLVIGGDQLLPSISANLGVYPTEPEADPVGDWLDSCAAFKPFATATQLVLPGHKLPFTGLPARLDQMIQNHHGALQRLMKFLDRPKSAGECFLPLFKREITGSAYGLALVEAVAHVNHLHRNGQVTRHLSPEGAWLYTRA